MAHEGGMTITPKVLYTAAGVAVLVSLLAWAVEWSGMAYVCPYCRAQRTVIGVLGVLTLFARPGSLIVPWLSYTAGGFAFVVAAMQHFNGWKRISAGDFSFNAQWYIDPWLLSGGAMLILVAQLMLVQAACRRSLR
ncbi:hypothetical protein [Stenotrophomonas maltophilia]|uniref:hypothetical protein n=1 Tax=Stenotrophomonas maltophilia TaxID=40324 RepID=UPI0015DC9D88|nr:hypothetical protein [Stenotrophomonas maltophilia]BBQ13526.1 hypothetical protein WP1W18C01_38860 [Stenotrophomonas maltophilia]